MCIFPLYVSIYMCVCIYACVCISLRVCVHKYLRFSSTIWESVSFLVALVVRQKAPDRTSAKLKFNKGNNLNDWSYQIVETLCSLSNN